MTAAGAPEVMGDGGSALATTRTRARRALPLLVGAALIAVIVLIGLLRGSDADDAPLSPGNPAPDGARAVAEVLSAQGVDVVRTGTLPDALAALAAADTGGATLFLNDARGYLSADQVAELAGAADSAVLASPGARQLSALDTDFGVLGPAPSGLSGDTPAVAADCPSAPATAARTITATGTVYSGPVECFPVTLEAGSGEPALTGGLLVTSADGALTVLGAPTVLANSSITDQGAAALALQLLGAEPTLVWFEPSTADIVATGEGVDPTALLPPWVDPLLLWLLVCVGLAVLWRGRRTGPLAVEPLPVVVRAAETAEGRARLYQNSGAVAHAAATLRAASLERMARRLRVDRSASPDAVVDAAARHGGRSREELRERLLTATPTTHHELVLWAQDIQDIEKEITSS